MGRRSVARVGFAAIVGIIAFAPVGSRASARPTTSLETARAQATPSPAPAATPTAAPHAYVRFVEADLLPGERTANAYVPDRTGPVTNRLRAAVEYKFFGANFIEVEYRRWKLVRPDGFVSRPLARAPAFVPAARYTEQDVFVNSSIVRRGHTYLATSTLIHSTSDGDPNLHSSFGIGLERLPDPSQRASLSFAYYYYPEVTGKIRVPPNVSSPNLRYAVENVSFGGTLRAPRGPLFLTAGVVADRYLRKQHDASNATHVSTELGIGARF